MPRLPGRPAWQAGRPGLAATAREPSLHPSAELRLCGLAIFMRPGCAPRLASRGSKPAQPGPPARCPPARSRTPHTRPSWCVWPSSPPAAAATTSCHAATRQRGGARRCGAKSPAPGSRASHVTLVRAHAALALLLPAAAAPQAAPVLPAGPSGRMPCRPVTPARQRVGCYALLDHPGPGRAAAPPLPAGVLAPPELRHVNAAAAAACPTAWLQRSHGRRCSAAICTGSGGRKSAW